MTKIDGLVKIKNFQKPIKKNRSKIERIVALSYSSLRRRKSRIRETKAKSLDAGLAGHDEDFDFI